MSARLEAFLARLYVNEIAREACLADPVGEARRAGLDASECAAVDRLAPVDLRLAARSFADKRAQRADGIGSRKTARGWLRRLGRAVRGDVRG